MKKVAWLGLMLLMLSSSLAQAAQVEFNYTGRVKVRGEPFNGTGWIKLAIVDANQQTSFWSNDGTSTAGSEPTDHLAIDVIDGFFSIIVGDPLTGMEPLDPTLFNADEPVFLKVWFSDGDANFEELWPRRRIVNPALLGIQAHRSLEIYVDPTNGDDLNNGLTTDTAKQTIAAAWDIIPNIVRNEATIHLLPGIYYLPETIKLDGRTVIGDHFIRLLGDAGNPADVRITGKDPASPAEPLNTIGIEMRRQDRIIFEGLQFEDFNVYALSISNSDLIYFTDCVVDSAAIRQTGGYTGCTRTEFSNGPANRWSYFAQSYAEVGMYDCHLHDADEGMLLFSYSKLTAYGTTFENMNTAIIGSVMAHVSFVEVQAPNTFRNCSVGIDLEDNSVGSSLNHSSYTNVGQSINLSSGSVQSP